MANHTTGSQRYNARMDKIYKEAILNKQRYCKHNYCDDDVKCIACGLQLSSNTEEATV